MQRLATAVLIAAFATPAMAGSAAHVLTCHATGAPNTGTSWVFDIDRGDDGTLTATLGTAVFWHHAPTPERTPEHVMTVTEADEDSGSSFHAAGLDVRVASPEPAGGGTIFFGTATVDVTQPLADGPTGDASCSNDSRY